MEGANFDPDLVLFAAILIQETNLSHQIVLMEFAGTIVNMAKMPKNAPNHAHLHLQL